MLRINNLSKFFPSASLVAINKINLQLDKGDFCVIIGANGSGKSTLIKLINGQEIPDSGEIFINDQLMNHQLNCSQLIAEVGQDINKGTISEMTLLENIVLSYMRINKAGLNFYSRYKNEVIKRIKEVAIGLEAYIDQPISYLSGGQRQMIATIMAIYCPPQILLLDEHISALDPNMQSIIMEYTAKEVTKHKITTLMVTHKMDDALKYGNRLIMLNKGEIVFDIAGSKKAELGINQLLDLFHKYEDTNLI